MMLDQFGRIPLMDVDNIMAYVNKKLAEKVSLADLAKRIRSRAGRKAATREVHAICWLRSQIIVGNRKNLRFSDL